MSDGESIDSVKMMFLALPVVRFGTPVHGVDLSRQLIELAGRDGDMHFHARSIATFESKSTMFLVWGTADVSPCCLISWDDVYFEEIFGVDGLVASRFLDIASRDGIVKDPDQILPIDDCRIGDLECPGDDMILWSTERA